MDIPTWYLSFLGVGVATRLLFRLFRRCLRLVLDFSAYFFLKHAAYPHLYRRIPLLGATTRFQVLAIISYLAINILCMTIGVKTNAQAATRAGLMSTANLAPLFAGPRLRLFTDWMGISIRTQIAAHSWIGRVAIAQGLVHTIIQFLGHTSFRWDTCRSSGIIAIISFGAIFVLSFAFVRRIMYEFFLRSHFLLSISVIVTLWYHLKLTIRKLPRNYFLLAGISLWIFTTLVHWVNFIFQNYAPGRPFPRATVKQKDDMLEVEVIVPRPWRVKPGHFIYLSVPGVGLLSFSQSHPFMIPWWERDGDSLKLYLLVKPRRGFTSRLSRYTGHTLRAFIDGPYGVQHNLGIFGTVLMFASGVGIAGQLPYIKALVNGYNGCEVTTRRVVLFWQIDKEYQQEWVANWMDALLEADKGYILEISLYVLSSFNSEDTKLGDRDKHGHHNRIRKFYGSPDIETLLRAELEKRKGKMVVSLCADTAMSDTVRRIVQRNLEKRIRLVELEFEPSLRRATLWRSKGMDIQCKGVA